MGKMCFLHFVNQFVAKMYPFSLHQSQGFMFEHIPIYVKHEKYVKDIRESAHAQVNKHNYNKSLNNSSVYFFYDRRTIGNR